uniref:histidine kinase n=1 Tax=Euplotes crassus TaxID=5936 RepID=A0A7S3K7V0_EUPCR|mmetsp:Transcript_10784/g.10684  ORF Transcript_10784/g.10684 Transcript_10784/m.10684 type:complete len:178 (+) Transcript_10784:137-670(+)
MQIDIDPRIRRVRVYSDEKRIKQVLINLLSNSLKFTFSGSVTLSCKQVWIDKKLFAKFMVKDTGIGISQKQQAKLFKMFSMVKYTNQINPNGTGLGLTVSKKYVEALGGSIKLKSAKGAGTTVSFYIPLEDPPLAQLHIDENDEHFQSLESVVSFDFIERVHDIKDFNAQTPRFNLP